MPCFGIRTAEPADTPLILRFVRELAEYEHLSHEVRADEALLREWIFEKGKAKAVIAEENGEPVGFALYFYNFSTFLGRAGLYLEDLYVVPAARGKGYGKALLRHVVRICADEGCGRLEWACLDWNESSIGFYRSLGAVPMDDWTVYRLTGDTLARFAQGGK